jgi:7,8-dihydropterin-6-yl-methyl-4-(beta-D-ribofuranosyl)aminobenzene 5'-phosphate synthase
MPPTVQLHVVFDNVREDPALDASWGFACLVTGGPRTVLFDTGSDGDLLLANLHRMGLDPAAVDDVVLSHEHWDHVDGLGAIIRHDPQVVVHPLRSFSEDFHAELRRLGATSAPVDQARPIAGPVHTTGEVPGEIPEQALVIDGPRGLAVITGCAHPDVAAMAAQAREILDRPIDLLLGGFHLRHHDPAAVDAVIRLLDDLGVSRVAPSHCTGEEATARFRAHWGDRCLRGGVGAVISLDG